MSKQEQKGVFNELLEDLAGLISSFIVPSDFPTLMAYAMTCKLFSGGVDVFIREKIKAEFSQFFRGEELNTYQGQDLRTLWLILNYHKQATQILHQNTTPYYSRLVYQLTEAFLARRKQTIEKFPWACYIRGNLMWVYDEAGAYHYFKAAIRAKPSLPLAKQAVATFYMRGFNVAQIKALCVDIEPLALAIFVREHFFISYLKSTDKYKARMLADIFGTRSPAYYEFLQASYEYDHLVPVGAVLGNELVEKLVAEMQETDKDPAIASGMAEGLLQPLLHLRAGAGEGEKKAIQQKIDLCKGKGGFSKLLTDPQERRETLVSLTEEKVYVRPGWLGAYHVELASVYLDYAGFEDSHENHTMILNNYWQAVRLGYPYAINQLNIFFCAGKYKRFWETISQIPMSNSPEIGALKPVIFQGIFVAYQTLSRNLEDLHFSPISAFSLQTAAERLKVLAAAVYPDFRAFAETVLGLLACQDLFTTEGRLAGDYKKAGEHFKTAEKASPEAFKEYLAFIEGLGYKLFPEVRECLQNYRKETATTALPYSILPSGNSSSPVRETKLAENNQHLLVNASSSSSSSQKMATKSAIEQAIKPWLVQEAKSGKNKPITWAMQQGGYVQMSKPIGENTVKYFKAQLKDFQFELVPREVEVGKAPTFYLRIHHVDPASFQAALLSAAPGL